MPMTTDLYLALLAMDSYNRGYSPGVDLKGAGFSQTQIGNATIGLKSDDPAANLPGATAEGFFAQSYTLNGQKIISYRGTEGDGDYTRGWSISLGLTSNFTQADEALAFYKAVTGLDVLYGWLTGAGFASEQSTQAAAFYQSVTGQSINAGVAANILLTGHSLSGGLAGYLSALTGTQGIGIDHMPFGLAVFVAAANDNLRHCIAA
jgi:hypothetical protein